MRLQRGLRPQQARDRAEQPHPTITEAVGTGQGPGNRELDDGAVAGRSRIEKVYTVLGPGSLERQCTIDLRGRHREDAEAWSQMGRRPQRCW